MAFQLSGSCRKTDVWAGAQEGSHSHREKGHHRTGQCSGEGDAMEGAGGFEVVGLEVGPQL